MIKHIIQKQQISVTKVANSLHMSRNHFYRCMKEYDAGNFVSKNRDLVWAMNYLFKDDLSFNEFGKRLEEVDNLLSGQGKIERKISKDAFEVSTGNYITKNYVKTFSYHKVDDKFYELVINYNERYGLTETRLREFLYMYDL